MQSKAFSVALALLLTGCAPIIAHGPAVHGGFSGGVTGALGNGPTYENGDDPGPFYLGTAVVSAAYGVSPARKSLPALSVGVQVPTEGGVAGDIYLQAPRAWLGDFAMGAGLLAGTPSGRTMPYLQVGIESSDHIGVDAVVGHYSHSEHNIGYSVTERAWVNWLSLQLPLAPWATGYFHGGFARGHVRKQDDNSATPYIDENRWVRLGGATIEFHRPRK